MHLDSTLRRFRFFFSDFFFEESEKGEIKKITVFMHPNRDKNLL